MKTLHDMIYENMAAIGQEEKEKCIHCGMVWYRIHYHDGVCHRCWLSGRPGRTELAARRRSFRRALAVAAIVLGLLIFFGRLG